LPAGEQGVILTKERSYREQLPTTNLQPPITKRPTQLTTLRRGLEKDTIGTVSKAVVKNKQIQALKQ